MKAKAEIIKYLKDSFAFGHKSVATLNSSNLVEPITSKSGRQTTRLFQATFAAAHCFDHYGQMIEYLRMNGIATGKPRAIGAERVESLGRDVALPRKLSEDIAARCPYQLAL